MTQYEIRLVHFPSENKIFGPLHNKIIYDIQFGILHNGETSIKQTNNGNSLEILGSIQNGAIDKFNQEHIIPDIISLTASNDPEHNTPDQFNKRNRTYYAMARRTIPTAKHPYIYPNVYPNIVGKRGTSTLMSKIELSPDDLTYISNILKNKIS